MSEPLILMAIDQTGWCLENNANQIQRALSEHYRFKVVPWRKVTNETCDLLVCMWWAGALLMKANTKCKHVMTCIYDGLSWKTEDSTRTQFKLVLRNSDVLGVCNQAFMDEIQATYPKDVPYLSLIEDGVDTSTFTPSDLPATLTLGWTGNSSRFTPGGPEDLKGVNLIRQAQDMTGVKLNILDSAAGGAWPLAKMPDFYSSISCYIVASFVEGTPNPLLEALASGRPVISTDVGLASKLIQDGKNGFIVERTPEAIAVAIRKLQALSRSQLEEMSSHARQSVRGWDWKDKAKAWKKAIDVARSGKGNPSHYEPPAKIISIPPSRPPQQPSSPPVESKLPSDGRLKVLLISDVRGWAFHQNMKDLETYLADRIVCKHWFIEDLQSKAYVPDMEEFDVVFSVYHRWGIDHLLPWEKAVGSLRALWFKPEAPQPPGPEEFDLVNKYRAFHVVTQQNYDELKDHCPHAVYLTNPVDHKRFPESTPVQGEVIANWNGNARHRSAMGTDVKAFYPIIQPACKTVGIPLNFAEYHTARLSHDAMQGFYMKSNLAICMSLYEGASNSTMEAMCCGHALITTDVGNHREMHENELKYYGASGVHILEERSVGALVEALRFFKDRPDLVHTMGQLNRREIIERWSWEAWKDRYFDYLKMGSR